METLTSSSAGWIDLNFYEPYLKNLARTYRNKNKIFYQNCYNKIKHDFYLSKKWKQNKKGKGFDYRLFLWDYLDFAKKENLFKVDKKDVEAFYTFLLLYCETPFIF